MPFAVTVSVAGPAKNVVKVEFRRNNQLLKTLTKANQGSSRYVLRIDPRRLRAKRAYAIATRVVIKAPGSFSTTTISHVAKPKPVSFVPVARCLAAKPPPTAG
jgi:hypothetical protein